MKFKLNVATWNYPSQAHIIQEITSTYCKSNINFKICK